MLVQGDDQEKQRFFKWIESARLCLFGSFIFKQFVFHKEDYHQLWFSTFATSIPFFSLCINIPHRSWSLTIASALWAYDLLRVWLHHDQNSIVRISYTVLQLFLVLLEFRSRDAGGYKKQETNGLSSCLSRATVAWLSPAIKGAHKTKTIRLEDIPDDEFNFRAEEYTKTLERNLNFDKKLSRDSLFQSLARSFLPKISICTFVLFLHLLLKMLDPLFLKNLIHFIEQRYRGAEHEFLKGIHLCLSIFIIQILLTQVEFYKAFKTEELGIAVVNSLETTIYKKLLRLSQVARKRYTNGKLTTMITSDVSKVEQAVISASEIVMAPLQLIVCFIFLWRNVGLASLGGVFPLLSLLFLNTHILRFIGASAKRLRSLRQRRNHLVNDGFWVF